MRKAAVALVAMTSLGVAPAAHAGSLDGRVDVPYAFPAAGRYRMWVQFKRSGEIKTAAFDFDVK